MPPIDLDSLDLDPTEDVTAYTLWSKKRKAQDPLTDEVRREKAPANGQQTPHLKNTIANRYAAAQKERLSTSGAQRSGEDRQAFMVEQSLSSLLEILSSSSVGMNALTSQVATFGVLQNAHACATTGDELGFEYVRMFIARLAQQTSDQAKVAKVTEVLHKKLQDQVMRAFAQAQSLSNLLPSKTPLSDGKIASDKQSKVPAQRPTVVKPINVSNVSVRTPSDTRPIQPAPYKDVPMQTTPVNMTAVKASSLGSSNSRQPKDIKFEENVRDKSVVQNDRVLVSRVPPSDTVEKPNVPHVRPHHHVYPCTSSDGVAEKNAAISADIRNYSEPGEDLDWTKVSDPAERKRLQGIVGGRKYRERQLAAQGKGGSGGNYPGAAGEGSTLSAGYGPQRPYGYSKTKSKSPQPLPTNVIPAKSRDHSTSTPSTLLHKALGMHPGSSATSLADDNVPRRSLSSADNGRDPVIYHSLEHQTGEYWNRGRLTNSIECPGSAAPGESSTLVISDDDQELQGKSANQGGYEDSSSLSWKV